MTVASPANKTLFFTLALFAVAIADAYFKYLAVRFLPSDVERLTGVTGWPILTLALHRNPGIAFDLPIPLAIVIPITLIICGAFSYIAFKHRHDNLACALAATAAVIGALGNAIDRLINGFTTDYLIFFKTSAINLSDVLILIGILGVVWYDKRIPGRTSDLK